MSMMTDPSDVTPLLASPPSSLRPPYGLEKWGPPYFSVNSSGNISVRPEAESNDEIDLLEVVEKATSKSGAGLRLPLLVRFPGVLKNRIESLHHAFEIAIENQGYSSRYQGVYPVKCNQDRFIVKDIVKFGSTFRFGLEAGSKPELLLAMSCLCKGSPEAYLICNGFKDSEYVSLALIAQKLNFNAFIVLELEQELELVLDLALKLGVETPLIGVRAKLQAQHNGHFGSTSGQNGKFGLTKPQIDRIVEELERRGKLACLQLLHFHMGSQIPSKERLYHGVSEGAQIYCDLAKFGANSMRTIDVGGGLGVDYDGSKSENSDFSVEYTLEEYANTVVHAVCEVCDERGVDHPVICSESGRAIVSHHSILIFEAFSATNLASENVNPSVIKAYHVNLSIFTSIPDFWGIKHLFPILPIHRLNEMPNVRGTLSDLTCDSDGVMAKFIGGNDSLMLHELEKGKGYYLGMFLAGAYQEALGGHHNLFGGPSVVHVETRNDPPGFALERIFPGRSCGDVLRVMHHDPEDMKMTLKERADELGHGILVDSLDRSFENMPYLFRVNDQMNENGDFVASSSNGTISLDRGENRSSDGEMESCIRLIHCSSMGAVNGGCVFKY